MDQYGKDYFKGLDEADETEVPRNLRILRLIESYKKNGRLLDVGVGTGLFLSLAKSYGWEIYGLDISRYATRNLAKKLKIKICHEELRDATFKKSFFDVINMRHTIEHIKNPEEALAKAYLLLKPGGILCISTPNSFGFHAKVFGKAWPHWSLPYHLHFFSKKSLCQLVKNVGLQILEAKTEEITVDDWPKFLISRLDWPVNYHRPSILSKLLDRFLAQIGWGEGLIVVARKRTN